MPNSVVDVVKLSCKIIVSSYMLSRSSVLSWPTPYIYLEYSLFVHGVTRDPDLLFVFDTITDTNRSLVGVCVGTGSTSRSLLRKDHFTETEHAQTRRLSRQTTRMGQMRIM